MGTTNSVDQFEAGISGHPSERMYQDVAAQDHYAKRPIEPIRYMKETYTEEEFIGFLRGNVDKYLARWKDKGGVNDLNKSRVYLNWLIEFIATGDISIKSEA